MRGGKRLFLSKIGNARIVVHRDLPSSRLKTCTVRRGHDGKWYASLVYDEVVPLQDVVVPESWKAPIGVDVGLISLVVTSDGEEVAPPKFFRRTEEKLKRAQRVLSRRRKGSKNRWKARQRVASLHAKVASQRADFNHKLSARLVQNHDLIAFEDLRVSNMVKNHSLAKSVSDASWGQLATLVKYKAEGAGKTFVKVDAGRTTQECAFCGALNKVDLSVREFECAGCHRWLHRDVNAARIVLKRAIAQVGQDRRPSDARSPGEPHQEIVPELTPVETGPPLQGAMVPNGASLIAEAGTIRDPVSQSTTLSGSLEAGLQPAEDVTNLLFP